MKKQLEPTPSLQKIRGILVPQTQRAGDAIALLSEDGEMIALSSTVHLNHLRHLLWESVNMIGRWSEGATSFQLLYFSRDEVMLPSDEWLDEKLIAQDAQPKFQLCS